MRRWFALLLAVVLPLNAVAAQVIPITGMPGHGHAHVNELPAAEAASIHYHGAAKGCPFAQAYPDAGCDSETAPHLHLCPHLGMASIPASMTPMFDEGPAIGPDALASAFFASVTHEIPTPAD